MKDLVDDFKELYNHISELEAALAAKTEEVAELQAAALPRSHARTGPNAQLDATDMDNFYLAKELRAKTEECERLKRELKVYIQTLDLVHADLSEFKMACAERTEQLKTCQAALTEAQAEVTLLRRRAYVRR